MYRRRMSTITLRTRFAVLLGFAFLGLVVIESIQGCSDDNSSTTTGPATTSTGSGGSGGSAGSAGASGSAGSSATGGSSGSGGGGNAGADSGSGGGDAAPDGASNGDASNGDGGTAPGTPVLMSATLVMHGTMALAWENPASTCTAIEINRKVDSGMYSVAQTLSGQTMSAQDMPGHTSGTYCYTITCKLNDLASSPSNEKCVTQ